ncbi:MAG TPA: radical SAM family heme chaperone HemW [Anaerolineales bacterium]|nr:radical SAM family heme chaperone HemW [Anaerolineales bacterium]
MPSYSLYLHIPFCHHRCNYCDFNTYAGLEDLIPDYVHALCRETMLLAESAGERLPVGTIFFGGGTPSLLPIPLLEQILATINAGFDLLPDAEITLEANPGTLSLAYLLQLRALGVNRLSLGMQSAQPEELRLLEREHDYGDVLGAVLWARQAGFKNLNLDLIFGLPYQTVAAWENNLELALRLDPDHLSLYALTLEHGTSLAHWVARGLLAEPDQDLMAEMYELASGRLEEAGFEQYEISNWARRSGDNGLYQCRHNLQYWRNLPYLGIGAGAHGYAGGVRTANILAPAAYIQRCLAQVEQDRRQPFKFPLTPATVNAHPVDVPSEIGDTLMMGLRLTLEGVSRAAFLNRFGTPLESIYHVEIEKLIRQGLLEWADPEGGASEGGASEGDRLRLTQGGRLLGNQVFIHFI